jgi:Arc/MetJ-type ribon-helix-helix transcriptional regulator
MEKVLEMRQPARKITVQLPAALVEQMQQLIASGQAASQRALIEKALQAHFEAMEDAWLRAEMAKAAGDPMFVADNAEVANDFAAADAEMLRRVEE